MIYFRFLLVLLFGALLGGGDLQAQGYDQAIGLRLGYPTSISYKTFRGGGSNAIEAFVSFRSYGRGVLNNDRRFRSFSAGVGYQVHNSIREVSGLMWYYGVGGRIASYNSETDRIGIGLLGFLGLDYKFADAPINLSLDWVPTFWVAGYYGGFGGDNGALAIRYTF